MNLKAIIVDILAAVFVLAIIYVLVRPKSKAVETLNAFVNAVVAMTKTATTI